MNIDIEVQRLVQAEINDAEAARAERIRQQVLERQADEQRREGLRQRIATDRAQAAQMREQAAQIRAEAEPHLVALERLEGVRPVSARSRSQDLEAHAHRLDLGIEDLEYRLEHPR